MEIERQGQAISAPRPFTSIGNHHHHHGSNAKAGGNRSSFPSTAPVVRPGVPLQSVPSEKKLAWLRSQIVGADADFESPFGKRLVTYADHTASGRCLRYIEDFITTKVLPSYGNTHTSDSYVGSRTTRMVHEAAQYIKSCLGCGPGGALLFCGSGSTGSIKRLQEVMGITVPSILRDRVLGLLPSEERWVVFVGPFEHHSNLLSWRQSLAEVVEIGLDGNGLVDMAALRQNLEHFKDKNRPLLGSFSACSNVTGTYTDTRSIAELLHRYGAFACFDFAASGPYSEIDMRLGEIDGYDAIFLSPHKFLGGPGSPGILLMRKALYRLASTAPSTCGGGTVNYVNGFSEKDTLYIEDIEERENAGTPQIIQTTRAALAFWVKDFVGCQVIQKLEHEYISEAIERLLPNRNIEILGNKIADRQAILSFIIYSTTNSSSSPSVDVRGRYYLWEEVGSRRDKPLHGAFIATLLNDLFGIQARGGCACAGPYGHALLGISEAQSLAIRSAIEKGYMGVKPGWTRVSFPYYMSHQEFEFILAALEFVATYGQRFLPLYHFNLRTGSWAFTTADFKDLVGKNIDGNYRFPPVHRDAASSSDRGPRNADIANEYASYLRCARHVAGLLPKFPPPRQAPENIDQDLLYFRI